jgi:hypothetical protein
MNLKTLWPLVRPIKITKRFIANHLAVFKISGNLLPRVGLEPYLDIKCVVF